MHLFCLHWFYQCRTVKQVTASATNTLVAAELWTTKHSLQIFTHFMNDSQPFKLIMLFGSLKREYKIKFYKYRFFFISPRKGYLKLMYALLFENCVAGCVSFINISIFQGKGSPHKKFDPLPTAALLHSSTLGEV